MSAVLLLVALLSVLIIVQLRPVRVQSGGGDPSRGSKCFSCEAQDEAMGIDRDYGSKCISCEIQDRRNGIHRGYGSKWF
jgi:hypothetical protein